MQILGNEKALKDKNPNDKTLFEKEREEHLNDLPKKTQVLSEARSLLYQNEDG